MLVGFLGPPGVLCSCFVLLYSPSIMPRDGALILSEVRVPVLSVVCAPCGRRERYDVERQTQQYGWDAKLTDLLPGECTCLGSASKSLRISGPLFRI